MRRHAAFGRRPVQMMKKSLFFIACHAIEDIHPLQGGFFRRKIRSDRRPGMPVVNPLVFYPWRLFDVVRHHLRLGALAWRFHRARMRVENDPAKLEYMDLALTLDNDQDLEALELLATTEPAEAGMAKRPANIEQPALVAPV
jgi:hypothetical protein